MDTALATAAQDMGRVTMNRMVLIMADGDQDIGWGPGARTLAEISMAPTGFIPTSRHPRGRRLPSQLADAEVAVAYIRLAEEVA